MKNVWVVAVAAVLVLVLLLKRAKDAQVAGRKDNPAPSTLTPGNESQALKDAVVATKSEAFVPEVVPGKPVIKTSSSGVKFNPTGLDSKLATVAAGSRNETPEESRKWLEELERTG